MAAYRDKGDNLFGVCAALGQDFGFNPLWLRITLAVALLWNPVWVLGAYAAMGVIVLASRLIFPNPRRKAEVAEAPAILAEAPVELAQAA